MMALSGLKAGNSARVLFIHVEGGMRRRLLDMGLTKGAEVECLYESPSGNPRAYLIRGAVIALRKEDAGMIEIF